MNTAHRPKDRLDRLDLRLWAALLLVLGVVSVGSVVPAAPAAAADGSLTISGRGWGHGRGMGQYGAYGYAVDHGWTYDRILAHYYGGTTLRADAGNPVIGVDITRLAGRDLIVRGPAKTVDGVAVPTEAVLVRRQADGRFSIWTGPGCAGPWTPWRTGEASGVVVRTSADPGTAGNHLRLCEAGRTTGYRGSFRVVSVGNLAATINEVPTDDYLRSVVPSESPASWGGAGGGRGMQALQAQAVAARSYALSSGARPSGARTCDTTACQVYGGSWTWPDSGSLRMVEAPATDTAVRATTGQVMRTAGGAIARTEFSSSTGGYTAGGVFPAVPDAGDATSINPNRRWTVTVPLTTVANALGTGPIASIAVTARNGLGADGGRARTITVRSTAGAVSTFTGDRFRSALGLRSDWFSISGITPTEAAKVVRALYLDILDREPDPGGLATWTDAVLVTGDTGQVARGIVMSPERLHSFVQRQYRAALRREPDPTGTATWVGLLQRGMTVPELQVQVYASAEALSTLGGGDVGTWVDGVYKGILGRSAGASERAAWASEARRSGLHAVARAIILSDEAALRRLDEYYRTMLGRPADPSGIATYKPMMAGQGDFILPVEIGRSVEYFNRSQAR